MDKSHKLDLYEVDLKYIRDLQKVDDNVMSSSPQIGKDTRKYIGIVTILDNKEYCIPLSSGNKDKFQKKSKMDLIKILDDSIKNENGAPKVIAVLNINNMIPVHSSVITKVNIELPNNKKSPEWHYKRLQIKEVEWCRNNVETILNRASKVYNLIINEPDKNKALTKRCCDFKKLEDVLQKRLEKSGITLPDTKAQENRQSAHAKPPKNGNIKQITFDIPTPRNTVQSSGAAVAVIPAPNRFSGFIEFLNDIKESFTKLFQKHTKPETNADVIQKPSEAAEETAENKEELQKNIPSGLLNLIEARKEYLSKKIEKSEYHKALAGFMRSLKSESEINEAVDMLNEMSGELTAAEKNCVKNEIFNLQHYSREKFHPENKSFLEELRDASADKSAKQHDDAVDKVYSPDRSNFDR